MINRNRLNQTFLDLVKINSPSKCEREVADYVKAKLASLGFDVEEDDAGTKIEGNAGNVIAIKKGTISGAEKIFFCSHMDTVEPTDKLNVIFDGEVFKTDGNTILGADDKAGVAAILEGVQSILESATPHGDIQIIFCVSEETGLFGAKEVDLSKIDAKMGYVLDTGKPVLGITVSAPSHENIIVEVIGKASHAGIAPEEGISAIIAASRAIAKMKVGRIDEETTANIGVIEGGKARNIVPDHVTVKAEARSRNEEKLVAQVEHMKRVFEEEATAIGATVNIQSQREYSTFRWSESDDVVKLAMAASNKIGVEPSFHEGGGGSDANVFNGKGLPAVLIGLGYEGIHGHSESISADNLAKAAEFVSALVEVAAKSGE